ncbi:MAG: threonine synthase [bacterium]
MNVIGFRCVLCDRELPAEHPGYTCPDCGAEGILDVQYDYERARAELTAASLAADPRRDIWRYAPLLPAPPPDPWPGLPVGGTPLLSPGRLAQHLGLPGLLLKNDGQLPTGSLKDRASALAVAQALERGVTTVAGASTGNAASSLAGLAAPAGLRAVIFVPADAPPPKLAQLRTYGALVVAVQGSYDQAFDLCLAATRRFGWYSRNTAYNPVLGEGKKTVSLELAEQLGWQAPDWIAVPVGDGCIIGGVGKGLRDLRALGLLDRMPRLLGVQAEGSAAIHNAWKAGKDRAAPVAPDTLADSISVGQPRDAVKALRAVRDSDGQYVTVSDAAILEAGRLLGRLAGVFAEPAASASLAGVLALRERGEIAPGQTVVALITGVGLKDPQTTARGTAEPLTVAPDESALDEVNAALVKAALGD